MEPFLDRAAPRDADLRAPLRAVVGFSDILVQDHADQLAPQVRELVDHIGRAGRQGEQLVHDLLRFSRLGRQPLSKQTVSTSALVRDILSGLQAENQTRRIHVEIGDLPDGVADPALVRQVFELSCPMPSSSREREMTPIWADAEPAKGAAFSFTLRIAPS